MDAIDTPRTPGRIPWCSSRIHGIVVAVVSSAAGTSGTETFSGTIVASGRSGDRVVLASTIRARGVFDGVGTIVEIPNLPGDPDNINRDDLVFAGGTMHLVTTILDVSFSVNPRSCVFAATIQQQGTIVGGTGQFVSATGSSTGTPSQGAGSWRGIPTEAARSSKRRSSTWTRFRPADRCRSESSSDVGALTGLGRSVTRAAL